MPLRVLVIDDNEHFRHLLSRNLLLCRSDINVHEYDPAIRGKPDPNFYWADYDVVFLDFRLGRENGLDWLMDFKQSQHYPKTVFLVDDENLTMGKQARERGADAFVSKDSLTRSRLKEVVDQVTRGFELGQERPPVMDSSGFPSIKGYEFLEKLSQSEIASIFIGRSVGEVEKNIIKILAVDNLMDENYIDRFVQEYELVSNLKHPNIVKIYQHGITDEYLYMVMEYLPDGNLKNKIDDGILPGKALWYLVQIASGLRAIHDIGVIHRDIKPSNIMFCNEKPVIIDFGISKLTDMNLTRSLAGQVLGTPFYMSPEHGAGEPVDIRSDIYSLGVTFYEMLTGMKPFEAENPVAVVYKHLHAPIPVLPGGLKIFQPVIEGMMAKKPADRFQSVNEFVKYIQAKYSGVMEEFLQ